MEPMTAQMSAGAEYFLACLPFVVAAILSTYIIILDKTQN